MTDVPVIHQYDITQGYFILRDTSPKNEKTWLSLSSTFCVLCREGERWQNVPLRLILFWLCCFFCTMNSCFQSFISIQGVGGSLKELCECLCRVREVPGPQKQLSHRVPVYSPYAECMSLVLQALYVYWYWKPCFIIF